MDDFEDRYVAGKFYRNIEVDDRVTPDLNYCIYCRVTSHDKDGSIETLDYKISLDCLNGDAIKQCPSCRRIYILKDLI